MAMSETTEEPGEAEINQMLRAVAIVNTTKANIDDANLLRFIQDIAYAIHSPDEIAERWGLTDHAGLNNYLRQHPALLVEIAKLRAVHKSDASVEERNRLKANYGVEMALTGIVNMAVDPTLKAAERLDAFRALQKQAGVDKVAEGKGAVAANAFNVTINLPGRAPISTTVVPLIDGEIA